MNPLGILLLLLSISLSSGRNILSKSISGARFGKRSFFFLQAAIFLSGALILAIVGARSFSSIAPETLLYAGIYGILLLSAQWCYTAALAGGQVSICATVYSLGFILPTASGMIFWAEPISILKILGILTVIPTLILSASGNPKTEVQEPSNRRYIFPLLIAMLSSGGLGILQKVQQKSPFPEERTAFVTVAFLLAGIVSLLCALLLARREASPMPSGKELLFASGVGICFGSCNLLNTTLAGLLPSAVFFPLLNIGMILLSLLLSVTIFRERFTKRHAWILSLGALSILLIALAP